MELSSSSSDEETFEVEFWNNWLPSLPILCQTKSNSRQVRKSKLDSFPSSRTTSFTSTVDDSKFGNWIPPGLFLKVSLKVAQSPGSKERSENSESGKETSCRESSNITETVDLSVMREKFSPTKFWSKELNLSWGERVQLHDVTKFNDGDLTWGIVNLGIFSDIKLWVNEYGNICGLAEGKISKLGSPEVTFISIKSTELLQKMLSLSAAQWVSLCEIIQETKTVLKFDAFEVPELTTKTSLEKLWYFICKRRHFLPNQRILVKLCGAIKCLRKFKIITKLLVEDIRNVQQECCKKY